jgi:virginiamycin B lyase
MTGNIAPYRRSLRFSTSITLFLLLANLLVGCDTKTTHTFAGQMNIISLPQPYLLPESMVLGADGNMWFPAIAYSKFGTTLPSGAIGRVTPSGKITLFPLPTNSFPRYITLGPDGNFWFLATQGEGKVEYGTDTPPGFSAGFEEIGSITPAGKIHMIPLPSPPKRYPNTMTAGPDGNLWFTETLSEGYVTTIARMTPSGTITGEFSLPSDTDSAEYITTGPDGNLWFIIASSIGQDAHAKVGRITPQGKITVFDLPASVFDAGAIINGPDGNLWFSVGRDIVRITPDGHVKEFPLPTIAGKDQYSQPAAGNVTTGPDGALWFLAYPQHSVGRMTTDGTIQQYPYPASAAFPGIGIRALISGVFGADGTLWFTDGTQLGHFM